MMSTKMGDKVLASLEWPRTGCRLGLREDETYEQFNMALANLLEEKLTVSELVQLVPGVYPLVAKYFAKDVTKRMRRRYTSVYYGCGRCGCSWVATRDNSAERMRRSWNPRRKPDQFCPNCGFSSEHAVQYFSCPKGLKSEV